MTDELAKDTRTIDEKKAVAIDELANGAKVMDAASRAGVTRKTIHAWSTTDKEFMNTLAAEKLIRNGRIAAYFRMRDEHMMGLIDAELEKRISSIDDKTLAVMRKDIEANQAKSLPNVSYSETHKHEHKTEWNTAPADDGSTIEAEVIDSEATE